MAQRMSLSRKSVEWQCPGQTNLIDQNDKSVMMQAMNFSNAVECHIAVTFALG
jgi:hypothetical protein